MAFEMIARARKKGPKRDPGFQFSISLDVETTQELMQFMRERRIGRSEAVRHLLRQGLTYELLIIPEQLRRAEEAKRESGTYARSESDKPDSAVQSM